MTFPEYVGVTRSHLYRIQLFPVIQYGGRKTGNYFFSGVITYDKCSAPSVTVPKNILLAISMFLGSGNSITLSERLLWLDVDTGSEKFKTAVA